MNNMQITEFFGIQQQKDGSLLPAGSASDCRNMTTLDGNLAVARGYAKHIMHAIPSSDRILKLMIARGTTEKFFVATASNIYVYDGSAWTSVFAFQTPIESEQVDYLQTQIGADDYLIVATGCGQMVKIKLSDNTASLFGTGALSFSGSVSSYNSETNVVTLNDTLSAEAQRHAKLDGITINDVWLGVSEATGTTVTLSETPTAAPASGNAATIRGGGSDAHCNFIDMYYGRLFSSGDPSNPCRLYWSAVSGDGRTFEDWLSVTGSADASGGYVEIGDASGDAIVGIAVLATEMLIFKRYSVYRLYGDKPSTYSVERVENFSEYMSNASVVIKYSVPYYLTKTGIKYYDGTGILPINGGVRYLNNFVQQICSIRASKGVHADNVFYFSCKMQEFSPYDDALIVYDVARQSFTIRDGFGIADITQYDGTVYLVNENRYVYEFNKGTDYDGVNIRAYWETQHTDLGSKLYKKKIKGLLFRSGEGNISVTVQSGDIPHKIERRLLSSDTDFVYVPLSADLSNAFHIRFENVSGSDFKINGGIEIIFDKEVKTVS